MSIANRFMSNLNVNDMKGGNTQGSGWVLKDILEMAIPGGYEMVIKNSKNSIDISIRKEEQEDA